MNGAPQPPEPGASLALDAATIERVLKRIAHEIIERNPRLERVALVGVPSRGVELAERLARFIHEFSGVEIEAGSVDVSMHRDDLHRRRALAAMEPTRLPALLDEKTLILIDDVLFSGRTCRAAMDAISSFGRPARIQLAVLVDRGHRELPIRADYVGKNLPTSYTQRVFVRLQGLDKTPDAVWLEKI